MKEPDENYTALCIITLPDGILVALTEKANATYPNVVLVKWDGKKWHFVDKLPKYSMYRVEVSGDGSTWHFFEPMAHYEGPFRFAHRTRGYTCGGELIEEITDFQLLGLTFCNREQRHIVSKCGATRPEFGTNSPSGARLFRVEGTVGEELAMPESFVPRIARFDTIGRPYAFGSFFAPYIEKEYYHPIIRCALWTPTTGCVEYPFTVVNTNTQSMEILANGCIYGPGNALGPDEVPGDLCFAYYSTIEAVLSGKPDWKPVGDYRADDFDAYPIDSETVLCVASALAEEHEIGPINFHIVKHGKIVATAAPPEAHPKSEVGYYCCEGVWNGNLYFGGDGGVCAVRLDRFIDSSYRTAEDLPRIPKEWFKNRPKVPKAAQKVKYTAKKCY